MKQSEVFVMKQIPNNSGFVYEIHITTEAQQEQAKGRNNLNQVLAPFAKQLPCTRCTRNG